MLRQSCTLTAFLLAVVFLAPCGSRLAYAQPAFDIVDRQSVARGPMLATIGRFGRQGATAVAVASGITDEIALFPIADGGKLGEPARLSVGHNPRGLIAINLDDDDIEDLIAIDELGGPREALLLAFINAGGAFHQPNELPIETSVVRATRTGNFDGFPPQDIVTANGRLGTVSIVTVRRGLLSPEPNLFITGETTDVAALDLDDDGLDDLAVLTERDDGLSVVTTLRSELGGFVLLPPAAELDINGVRMTRGDYNNDGAIDLAVVAKGPSNLEYSIRLLLARSPRPEIGEPRFDIESFSFPCPPDIRGRPTRCTLNDLVSADFDRDGSDDLAISMPAPRVVAILPRERVGELGPPLYLPFAGIPQGLAAGDVSGDGVADLVITESSDDAVSIAVSIVPPLLEAGASCTAAGECETGACVDAVCCLQAQCALSERCDITGLRGNCTRPLGPGSACDKDEDCRSAMCSARAPATGVCLSGMTNGNCGGDCNEDGAITVDEILLIIQIGLGEATLGVCESADRSEDGQITVDEIIMAVDIALDGCPAAEP